MTYVPIIHVGFPHSHEVVPGLFVGDQASAIDQWPGTIISVVTTEEYLESNEPHRSIHIPLLVEDNLGNLYPTTTEILDEIADCIDIALEKGNVVVHCSVPGTIIGSTIPSRIDQEQHLIIGGDGKEHWVSNNTEHDYNGELLTIDSYGIPKLQVTPDHRFLVHRPYRSASGVRWKPNWKTSKTSSAYLGIVRHEETQPEWVDARDLVAGDALLSPYWNPVSQSDRPMPIMFQSEHPNSHPVNVPAIDADIAWLCGLYAGDGSAVLSSRKHRYTVSFTLSRSKDIERTKSVLSRFGLSVHVLEKQTYSRVSVNSVTLAAKFADWFGTTSSEKRLPTWIMRSPFRYSALDGLMAADGYKNKTTNTSLLRITSQAMAWQAWHLLVEQGHRPSIHPWVRRSGFANAKQIWEVSWTVGGRHSRTFHWNNYYCLPVKSIQSSEYEGTVHTLTVPDGETYLTNGAISHNCAQGVERSPLAVAWYLFRKRGMNFDEAYDLVKQKRPVAQDRRAWLNREARVIALPEIAYVDETS